MKLFLITILSILIYSCNNNSNAKLAPALEDSAFIVPKDPHTIYFPLNNLFFVSDTSNKEGNLFIKSIYSEILFNLHEPVLYNYNGNREVLRLLWIRPFDNPVVVMASKMQDSIIINIKELEKEFYNVDSFQYKIKIDTVFTQSIIKQNELFNDINKTDFLNLNSYDSLNDGSYKDAVNWVFESKVKGKYHCINRLYLDTMSSKLFPSIKKLYDIGNSVLPMENTRYSR